MTRGVKQSYSTMGYRRDSPDKNNEINTIPGGDISMQNVDHYVMAFPQNDQPRLMYPGNDYQFPNSAYVHEIPIKNNDMSKKGFSIPEFKYGGNKLGGMAIIPDNNPWSASTEPISVEYKRAMNGMMQNGGYLNFISYPEMPNTYAYGGATTNYVPVNQDNNKVEFINDKHGYNSMQTPGQHYTNEGYKKSTGSTINGQSWSKYGGQQFQQFMPEPFEYAYLANGGYIDKYNTGGQAENGGSFATDGPMIYDETPEMKEGGIHINSRPFYRNGGIVEGEYDIDEPLTMDEIKHLKSQGYDVHY